MHFRTKPGWLADNITSRLQREALGWRANRAARRGVEARMKKSWSERAVIPASGVNSRETRRAALKI